MLLLLIFKLLLLLCEHTFIFTAAKLPYPADDVSISVSTTTASITFTIPAIAYTPEQYYIEYIGLELQNQFTNSIVIMGVNNITAIDQEYTITLTGLEEDNSYNITVASVNCEGTTAETMDSFTTLPTSTLLAMFVIIIITIALL